MVVGYEAGNEVMSFWRSTKAKKMFFILFCQRLAVYLPTQNEFITQKH